MPQGDRKQAEVPHAEHCPLGRPVLQELDLKPRPSTCSSALLFLELLRTG